MRHPHEVDDTDDLLHHLMEDHDQHFMSTGREPENPEAALQHLCELHDQLHTVYQGETDNLHYDLMSGRWRYNNGRLAEATETGPVRHRAPVDLTYVDADEECTECGSMEGVEIVWVPDPGDSEYGDSLPRCGLHRPQLVDLPLRALLDPRPFMELNGNAGLRDEASDLGVQVIGSDMFARFRRRLPWVGGN